jgi:hypothetical protein
MSDEPTVDVARSALGPVLDNYRRATLGNLTGRREEYVVGLPRLERFPGSFEQLKELLDGW